MAMTDKSFMPEVPSNAENDWVTLLKDNARTGGQGAAALPSPAKALWQARLGSSVRSAPVLRGELLYVTATLGHLHAIHTETGRERWKFKTGGQIHSTPALSGSTVFFGCDDGKLYAVNGDSGAKVWEAASAGEIWSSPAVRQGV